MAVRLVLVTGEGLGRFYVKKRPEGYTFGIYRTEKCGCTEADLADLRARFPTLTFYLEDAPK